ncbi:hypothetical protein ACS127_12910 [Amphibacillus sp. Q70]|uniref:hypothetical protein n=1 Tax=Amphibacillus sp. Q70 TaxID=3453416 RepID=UPI003F865527
MVKSNIKASFPYDIKQVWEVVSSFQDSAWRSDLSQTKVLDAKNFIEYTKDGYATTFNITVIDPYHRLEFEIENDNMTGYWVGLFSQSNGKTEIDFTEYINAKKFYLKPFVKIYLTCLSRSRPSSTGG